MTLRMGAIAAAVAAAAFIAGPAAAQVDRDGQQRWINVVNQSGIVIREFYMTDVETSHWGDDRLGVHVIPPGQAMRVLPTQEQRVRGYCRYDMRVVFSNNQRYERRGVNLCEATSLVCVSTNNCGVR
jgi:hypothetical protein